MNETSNKRQVARNLIFNTISFGINLAISFLFTPYLIKVVGKEAYSFFPLVNNIIGYSSILTAAVGSMGGRFVSMSLYQDDKEGANQYFNSVWVANLLLSVFFTIVAVVTVFFIADILTIPDYLIREVQWLFAFGAISMILGLVSGLFGVGTYVKNRLDLQALRMVEANLIRITSVIILFYALNPSIIYMSLSAFIAALFGVYFNFSFKKQLLPELSVAPVKYFSWKKIKEVMSSGIWNSFNQLSTVLLSQVDLLITNIFIGANATGDYSIAKTAPILILSLLGMLSGTFIPQFNILFAQGKMKQLVQEVSQSVGIVSLLIAIPMGFLLVFSESFFNLWVPGQDTNTLYWLSFLTVAPLIIGASINPIYGLFTVTNKLKVPSLVVFICSVLQTIIILIVIKTTHLGIWSIPLVSGIQAILRNTIFTTIYGGLCLGQKWYTFFPALAKGVIAMLVVIAIGCIIYPFVSIANWITLISVFFVVGIVSLIINMFIVFDKNDRQSYFCIIKKKLYR